MSRTSLDDGIVDVHVRMNPFWRMKDAAQRTMREHSADFEEKVELDEQPERFVEYLDTQDVAVAAIINYVSPILSCTHDTN
jgi:uncharacterized protein